ncbi:MAG: tryptophan synthase subunit alpha [Ktedonobacteraceae bacterium]|nr:tryptophan synthase subunit alpha [Ktedonobacteraceae bacterium]
MQTTSSGAQHGATSGIPATKITRAFQHARNEGRGALIPYFMCGYPSAEQSVRLALAAIEGGADILELGMPFSDPLADGATIQHAGQAALEQGMTVQGCLDIATRIATHSDIPLVLMGYYNPILSYGLEHFCAAAKASGVSGMIVPDLPPEEAMPLFDAAYRHGLSLIFLIPPSTPDPRIAYITEIAGRQHGSFIYCVSVNGVTGSRTALPAHLRDFVARVRHYTKDKHLPLAVGFGLSTPAHIAEVTTYADGAVIASAIINMIDRLAVDQQSEAVRQFIQRLTAK